MRFPLQRLSPGPTIPEQMQAEFRAWLHGHAPWPPFGGWQDRLLALPMGACFLASGGVLSAARVLLRLDLITTEYAGRAFRVSVALTAASMHVWRRARHGRRLRGTRPR